MSRPDFQAYLRSLTTAYEQWWELYTLTDAVGREKIKRQTEQSAFPFDFGLMVQTVKPQAVEDLEDGENREKPAEKLERLPVLEGVRKYAAEHVLLVGRPGSGKSTALIRLLLEEAAIQRDAAARIPVLVELRYWQTGVCDRILAVLHQHDPALELDLATLKAWLRQGRFLLLMDGLNELPSETARREVATFRQDYAQTPMIFTTRELSVGGDLAIAKRLEMQPLTETQMQAFVQAYLPPNQAEQMLRQLQERLREFGQTPLLLWMLCGLFQQRGTVPPNLGLVFRQFTQGYERSLKQDAAVTDESRGWWSLLLQQLAFGMMQGENPQEKPTEFLVAIARSAAEDLLTQYLTEEKFDKPRHFAKQWLADLLKHHLIQENGDTIEFRHQLIQEYYAAEYLLRQLPKLSNEALQRHYLNYLKWTEPIALMLALVEDEGQAVRVVELAIGVDLMWGARSAGEVQPQFQAKTVSFITDLPIPPLLKTEFLEKTGSEIAIPELLRALEDQDSDVRWSAAEVLGKLNSEQAIPGLLKALEDQDSDVRESAATALGKLNSEQAIPGLLTALEDQNAYVRESAAAALGKLNSERAIPGLLTALEDQNAYVRRSAAEALGNHSSEQAIPGLLKALEHQNSDVRESAAEALGNHSSEQAIPGVLTALEDQDSYVRWSAAEALGNHSSEQAIPGVLTALEDRNAFVRWSAAEALGMLNSEQAIPGVLTALEDQSSDVRESAAAALGKLNSEQAIPGLLKALEDQSSDVRWSAAVALGMLNSEQAIPGLLTALEDQNAYVRRSAAEALGNRSSEQAIPGLLKALEHQDSDVRWSAAVALGMLNSEQVIPGVLKALEDQSSDVRESAAAALGKLNSEQAIPGVLKALEHQDSDVRESAAAALGKLNSERAIPGVLTALEDQSSDVRESAAALGNRSSEQAILGVLTALEHQNSDIRKRAAVLLGSLGSIGNPKLLEQLWEVQLRTTFNEAYSTIATIQANCKFYNYEIFQAAQAIDKENISKSPTRTILFLAASPADRPRLRLDEEARIITVALQRSNYGDRFELKQHWAVRPEDLHFLLPQYNPQIVYFCCHGEANGLALDNGSSKSQLVPTEAIVDHLSRFPSIECVVLNSCYSDSQAEAIVQHVPYVIGMSSAILDTAALKFSQGFYNALGADRSYEAAYENGKDAIALEGIPQSQIPILKQKPRSS